MIDSNKISVVILVVTSVFFGLTGCQKPEEGEHIFKAQEKALNKAKSLQNTIDEKMEKDRKRVEEATQ